jgi:YnbE-like lipoprotein
LTQRTCSATQPTMHRVAGFIALGMLAGCINIAAPDKPIEINLNINVKQEVVVKLQKDADDFITNNPELFPK